MKIEKSTRRLHSSNFPPFSGYNGTTGRLTVEIVKGSHFRNLSLNKAPDTYVKLCLVSSMGQEIARAKSSTKRGQPNPLFKETFIFQVNY